MDLTAHVDRLRHELALLGKGGDEGTHAIVDRLVAALEAPARLALLDALSLAADEITRDLAPGSVDVRLRGGDVEFVVTPPPVDQPTPPTPSAAPPPAPAPEEGESTARINLRLPEHLKAGIEQAAEAEHLSINAWLVRLVATALSPAERDRPRDRRGGRVGESWTGWAQ